MQQRSRIARGPSEAGDVIGWRRQRLRDAGFEGALAATLAADWAVDLHAVLELVDRGCPPVLAARILAPIEREPR